MAEKLEQVLEIGNSLRNRKNLNIYTTAENIFRSDGTISKIVLCLNYANSAKLTF